MEVNNINPAQKGDKSIWTKDDSTYNNNMMTHFRNRMHSMGYQDENIAMILDQGLPEMTDDLFIDLISKNKFVNSLKK